MTNKIIILFLVINIVLLSLIVFQLQKIKLDVNQVDRFQLFQGKQNVAMQTNGQGSVTTSKEDVILLLDKFTGKAKWLFLLSFTKKGFQANWLPCD